MPTKKEIDAQNASLNEQEKLYQKLIQIDEKILDLKKKAKAGDAQAIKDLQEQIRLKKQLNAENQRNESFSQENLDLSSLQEGLQKKIAQQIGKTNSGIMSASMGYYKSNNAAHKFLATITGLPKKQEQLNAAINMAEPLLNNNNMVIKQQGSDFKELISGSAETLDLTMKLAQNYDDIGGKDFQDMTGDADKNLKMRIREAEYIKNSLKPALEAAYEAGELDASEFEVATKNLKSMSAFANRNVKEAKDLLKTTEEQNIHSKLTAATIDYMSKPMEMLKTGMEALPFGGVASQFLNLEGIIGDFQSNIQQTIANSLEQTTENGKKVNNMNFGLAVSNVTKAMNESMDRIKKGVEGMSVAFKGMNRMSSGVMGALLPIVAILAVAGKLAQIFFKGTMETRKEMGLTFTEAAGLQKVLNTTALEFKLMGVSAEDVKAGAQGIMDNMGGVSQVTKENLTAFAQMNATLGISGENAGVLAVNMMAVGVSSMEAVNSQLQSVAALAQASGVAPASIMNDVAANSDKFAEFAKDGGENVFKAAIGARQLGVNMATVAGAADALLDFESSINSQMEASMLTGRMINTDRARELALAGDLEGMQKEIVSQIGSQAEFDRMNVIQRQAMAKAFGVSVQDLAKMVANQEKLNNMTEAQKQRQDMVAGVIQMVNSLFARMVKNLEPLIPIAIAILSPFLALGAALAVVVIATGEVLNFIMELGGLGKVIMGVVSALITYNFYQRLFNMQIGKSKKITLGKYILDSKVGKMLRLNTALEKLKNIQTMISNKLDLKSIPLKLKNIGLGMKEVAVKYAQLAATKALAIGTKIASVAMLAFNAVMSANPIALVVLGVVALIAGIALLVKKFGAAKVIGTILKVAFFPIFGVIGTFKMLGSLLMKLKGLFTNFGDGVMTALKIAFAPFFLAYKIFQKAKDFVSGFFGGGDEEGPSVSPESNAGKGGKVRQTVSEMTIRNGQVVESKSQTKEITMRLDKLNNTGQQNVDASNRTAGQTRRLNSSIATG